MFPESVTMRVLEVFQHRMNKLVMNRADTFAWFFENETPLNEDTMNTMAFAVLHSITALRI